MAYPATVFRVMIASPSDVKQERELSREIIFGWNSINSVDKQYVLLPIGWEWDAYPMMGNHPQDILNDQLLENCDVLVGIFWTRIGTPTKEYPSGTVEEIEKHIESGKPVMLYFSESKVKLKNVDQEQYMLLEQFKESCQDRGYYQPYEDLNHFGKKFSNHLQQIVNNHEYFEDQRKITDIDEFEFGNILDLGSTVDEELSEAAKTLLVETSKDPNGQFMRFGKSGPNYTVQTNNTQLAPDGNPRTVAKWDAAVEQLETLGYIEDVGYKNQMFKIKQAGWDYLEKNNLIEG